MRDLIINEINYFKNNENQLSGSEWDDIYFTTNNKKTVFVRDVDVHELNEVYLLRFLLFLTKMQDGAIDRRIRNTNHVKI